MLAYPIQTRNRVWRGYVLVRSDTVAAADEASLWLSLANCDIQLAGDYRTHSVEPIKGQLEGWQILYMHHIRTRIVVGQSLGG